MKSIAVIGAGVMGIGVAQTFSQADYDIILVDLSTEILEEAKTKIYNNLRYQNLFKKDKKSIDPDQVINNITFTTDLQQVADVDLVIENVPEKIKTKEKVYNELDDTCKEECIFAVNTSCIPITKIASFTKRPSQVIGTHFMNPVPMIAAVEVIKGYYTSDEVIEKIKTLIESVGKESVVVNDSPGFVSNRLSHLLMNEAAFLVYEQVASPEDVDKIFKKCYGHPMGPLETADLIGIDTVVDSLDVLYESYKDSKFRCCPLLRKMVDAGQLGRKTNKGFFTY